MNHKTLIRAGCLLLCAALFPAPGAAAPASSPRTLLTPLAVSVDAAKANPRGVLRQRAVRADLTLLRELTPGPDARLALDLFEDARFSGVLHTKKAHSPERLSLAGKLAEDDLGAFSFVINQGALVGTVYSPRARKAYRITSSADGTTVVRELDLDQQGECGVGVQPAAGAAVAPDADPAAAPAAAEAIPPSCGDDPSEVDVMILYTDVARRAAGDTAAIEAVAQLAVDDANTTYENSRITLRLRLVHTEEVTYNENGTFFDHLDRLRGSGDIFDHIPSLRNQYGADMVSLLVNDMDPQPMGGFILGLAGVCVSSGNAFSVVNLQNAPMPNWTLAHELGHNMGCAHDRADGGSGCYDYSYGWRFTGDSGGLHSTVMSTRDGVFTRIPYFSNPDVFFDGQPTGVAVGNPNEAHNVLTINNRAETVANWRRSTVWVDFAYSPPFPFPELGCFEFPFNTLGEGLNAVPSKGYLFIKSGSSSATANITKAMTIQAYGGPVTIGR